MKQTAMAKQRDKPLPDRTAAAVPLNARVTVVVVDDPYGQFGEKIKVTQSLRDDILAHLLARSEIDAARFEAGRRYERYVEQSQIGTIKAMDPTKEPVDGGGHFCEPVRDYQIAAVHQLGEAGRILGRKGEFVTRQILVGRRKFREIAASAAERDVAYVRRHFLDCLNELAILWGLASR